MENATLEYIALMVIREQRLGLAMAPQSLWQDRFGSQLLPLAFPGAPYLAGGPARDQALALCAAVYGQSAIPLPATWTYGPSPRHAIDRQRAGEPATAPFLRLARLLPGDRAANVAPRFVGIEVYRAALAGDPVLDAHVAAGVLWLSLNALRALISGARVSEMLRQHGVRAQLASGVALPEEAFFYLPAEYGERFVSRLAAKYGESAALPE